MKIDDKEYDIEFLTVLLLVTCFLIGREIIFLLGSSETENILLLIGEYKRYDIGSGGYFLGGSIISSFMFIVYMLLGKIRLKVKKKVLYFSGITMFLLLGYSLFLLIKNIIG